MNELIRRVIGLQEHEAEGGKVFQSVVIYLRPEQIGTDDGPGARCGKCQFFSDQTNECLLTDPAPCNADHGVCGLFLGRAGEIDGRPLKLIPKKQAGYIEDEEHVPTRCGNCEYYSGGEDSERGECAKVADPIFRDGCCSGWEPK